MSHFVIFSHVGTASPGDFLSIRLTFLWALAAFVHEVYGGLWTYSPLVIVFIKFISDLRPFRRWEEQAWESLVWTSQLDKIWDERFRRSPHSFPSTSNSIGTDGRVVLSHTPGALAMTDLLQRQVWSRREILAGRYDIRCCGRLLLILHHYSVNLEAC